MKQFLIGFFASIGFLSALVAQGEEPKPLLVPDYNHDGKIDAVDFGRKRDTRFPSAALFARKISALRQLTGSS